MNSRTLDYTGSALAVLSSLDARVLEQRFDQAPDVAFFVKDQLGQCIVVNQSLVQRHGVDRKSEVIGLRPRDICGGDFGRIPSEQDAVILRTGEPLVNHLEMQWHRPNEPVWSLTTAP